MVFIKSFVFFALFSYVAVALPLLRREVPQEHSHEAQLRKVRESLNLNNPGQITDPVFSLLGDAAAAAGAGNIKDLACLQQAVADQAFTNAKAAGDLDGMVNALIFRALERNTAAVGQQSELCTSIQAVNPEIAALTQHQDPASDGAAATNKAITLELAKQIASIGGNPLDALKAGTFAPGKIGDPTAAGNTCDDANDAEGCIFSQNLIVNDATDDEINAAVATISTGDNAASASTTTAVSSTPSATGTDCAKVTVTVTQTATATVTDSTVTVTVTATATTAARLS